MSDSNSLVGKLDSNTFPFEDGKLTANCSNKDSDECLTQLTTYKSVNKLHLEGFIFNEMNIKLFSNVICEMHIQELTLDQCNINDDLVNLLILPSGLKSIRLVDLNLSLVGIQSILDKLNHLLESFEVVDCLRMEVPQQKASTNSMVRKESLDLSRYSNLKTISIENLSKDFDSCNLLLSLTKLSLEKIKLSCIHLSIEEWTTLLNKWKEAGGIVFLNTLKVFDIEIQSIDESIFIQLIQFLFSIPSLEVLSLKGRFCLGIISLPPLPSTIKQFSLFPLKSIFMEDGKTLFCNSTNLSHLTHLTACNFFDEFPFDLFTLNQLEYLEIITMKTSRYSLKPIQPSGNLKYLSIQAKYLISLLFRFEIKFPVIETLVVRAAFSVNFDVHLKRIISSRTLKSLQIHYEYNDKFPLEIDAGTINSIEELKLDNVFWQFVCELIDPERFPCLTKIHLKTENCDLDLKVVLEKLSLFPKLNSLVLIGDFWLSNEELSFTFPNLTFFCLDCTKGRTIDLDYLLTCMPNLFALQLGGQELREVKLQNPIGIHYLTLSIDFFNSNSDFINIIKNIPNLLQLSSADNQSYLIYSVSIAPELVYYFKVMKKYFQNELHFKINPNCLPIKLLTSDRELLKLVRIKSVDLPNYLNRILPIDKYLSSVEQLFTTE